MKILIFITLMISMIYAQTKVAVDLEKLSTTARNEILNNRKKMPSKNDLDAYTEYAQKIGTAVKELCKTLNVEVNEFAKTPVGKLTVALLIWHIAGDDIKGLIGGPLIFIIINLIIGISFIHFHTSKRIKDKDGRISYISRYEFEDTDYKVGSAVVHVCVFVAVTITSLAITFS